VKSIPVIVQKAPTIFTTNDSRFANENGNKIAPIPVSAYRPEINEASKAHSYKSIEYVFYAKLYYACKQQIYTHEEIKL